MASTPFVPKYVGNDGLHFGGAEGNKIAKGWADGVFKAITGHSLAFTGLRKQPVCDVYSRSPILFSSCAERKGILSVRSGIITPIGIVIWSELDCLVVAKK